MSLKLTIPNILTDDYMSVDEIWQKVNNGFNERTGLDRTLRKLSEDNVIEQAEEKPLRYKRIVKQESLI